MAKRTRHVLTRLVRALPLAAVVGLLLAALFLVAGVERETSRLSSLSLAVLLTSVLALVVLTIAIVQRIARLLRDRRDGQPGALLRTRLVLVFIALSLPPAVVVFLFSLEFIDNSIEGWFDTGAEPALADSLQLAQLFLDRQTRESSLRMDRIVAALPSNGEEDAVLGYLFARVGSNGPEELTWLLPSGQVRWLVHIDPARMVADLPPAFALDQALRGNQYAAAESGPAGLHIRVLVPLETSVDGQPDGVLQGIFPVPEAFPALADRIEQAYFRFENASFLRQRLQQSFILILSLVLGITALLAILLALNASRRLVRPIRQLAEATETLRAGRFPDTLDVGSHDELGFLVESFNSMADRLAQARAELETQQRYLQTILERLSAGVIALDAGFALTASNRSASDILAIDLAGFEGRPLDALVAAHPALQPLAEAIVRRAGTGDGQWREEVRLESGDRTRALVCRGSSLAGSEPAGHVVVFDDVTMLDQAQRQAAWTELARRLAHEIKNPLTPIRLASERLRMRLHDQLDPDRAELLERATGTIINQVDALRQMVDAFGDYTRPDPGRREAIDLDALLQALIDLWSSGDTGVRFERDSGHGGARALGDGGQLQQVLNNLVQNAREAHPQGRPLIRLATACRQHHDGRDNRRWLELTVCDDGPGFDPELLARIFEPYVSSKPRGTGLGLAIVQRILDQMGGRITADNPPGGGARLTIELPPAD
ncbi:MAG: ATP-binding protein [Wenzhouxiangellaceae bacterium]|nr:ATP-binding protein [Wenzhouxiangellaceae bacterium]